MAAGDVITGKAMTVKYGATPAAANHVGMWSITKTVESGQFASNSTSGWRKTVKGVKHWSGQMTVFLHDGAQLEWSIEGAEVACQFHADGGDADYYSGTIQVTEVSEEFDADSGDPVSSTITFLGSGALTSAGTLLDV